MVVKRDHGARAARGVERALARPTDRLERLRVQRAHEHEALLRAARRVFLRRGYRSTRVEDILREAGISTRAFYRFHEGKSELFLELFDRTNRAAMQRLREGVARLADPTAQLDAYVAATLDLAYDPRLRRETALFADVPGEVTAEYAGEVAACREQLVAVLQEILARGRASGAFPDVDPETDAWALHGALGAILSRALGTDPPPARERVERRLREICRAVAGAR